MNELPFPIITLYVQSHCLYPNLNYPDTHKTVNTSCLEFHTLKKLCEEHNLYPLNHEKGYFTAKL